MLVTPFGIVIDVSPEQPENAAPPMLVTPDGIVTFPFTPATTVLPSLVNNRPFCDEYTELLVATLNEVSPEQPENASGTTGERRVPDARYAVRNRDRRQSGTTGERRVPDARHAVRNDKARDFIVADEKAAGSNEFRIDRIRGPSRRIGKLDPCFRQVGTTGECIPPDARYAVRNRDRRQSGTTVERSSPDARHAVRNRDRCQSGTTLKRRFLDARHAVRNRNRCQFGTTPERIDSDARHRIAAKPGRNRDRPCRRCRNGSRGGIPFATDRGLAVRNGIGPRDAVHGRRVGEGGEREKEDEKESESCFHGEAKGGFVHFGRFVVHAAIVCFMYPIPAASRLSYGFQG